MDGNVSNPARLHPATLVLCKIARPLFVIATVLILASVPVLNATPLDNVPLHDWTYEALDKVMAYVDYRYPTLTLPLAKAEFAEILSDIGNDADRLAELNKSERVRAVYDRLRERFWREIEYHEKGHRDGKVDWHLDVVDRATLRAVATDVDGEYGDITRGECRDCGWAEARLAHGFGIDRYFGIQVEESFWGRYRFPQDDWDYQTRLERGIVRAQVGNVEVMAGRESLWWGVGRHGTLVLSDNAPAFDLLKVGMFRPAFIPDPRLRMVGRFDFEFFITQLEGDRERPFPKLFGLRGTWSPTGYIDVGITRTIMYGGGGVAEPEGSDWANVIMGVNEHREGDTVDTNQMLNIEIQLSLAFLRIWSWMPFKELRIGTEYGAESLDKESRRPKAVANLWTVYVDFGPVDVRYEWTNLYGEVLWYEHFSYMDGYTYKGDIIGHYANYRSIHQFVQVSGYPATWLHLSAWWINHSRYSFHRKKRFNSFGLKGRGFFDFPVDLFGEVQFTHVNRHGVGSTFGEEITTGLRIEAGVTADF